MQPLRCVTSPEQSKRLIPILSIQSPDFHYVRRLTDGSGNRIDEEYSFPRYGNPKSKYANYIVQDDLTTLEVIPAWSLPVLLSQLPNCKMNITKKTVWSLFQLVSDYKFFYLDTKWHQEPVDAAVEMILKLHEKQILNSSLTGPAI